MTSRDRDAVAVLARLDRDLLVGLTV